MTQAFFTMIGRREGGDIVQLGTIAGGNRLRWSFREIEPDAFLWRGEISADGGATWRTNVEFRARRNLGQDAARAA